MDIMKLFSPIEKLITEHGSAAIQVTHISFLREQLSIIRDSLSKLDAQNEILKGNLTESKKENDTLQEKYKKLKNEIDNWEKISSQYEFQKVGINKVSIFAKKPFSNSYEKDTYSCPNCYGNRIESFLQPEPDRCHDENYVHVFCPNTNCKLKLRIIYREPPSDYDLIQRSRGIYPDNMATSMY